MLRSILEQQRSEFVEAAAEVRIDERNEIIDQNFLERAEVQVANAASARAASRAVRCTRAHSRSSVGRSRAAAEGIAAEFHRNDERLRFPVGEEIVQDQ